MSTNPPPISWMRKKATLLGLTLITLIASYVLVQTLISPASPESTNYMDGETIQLILREPDGSGQAKDLSRDTDSDLIEAVNTWLIENRERMSTSFTTYAPELTLRAKSARVEFRPAIVVVSFWNDEQDHWSQYTADPDAESEAIRTRLLALME